MQFKKFPEKKKKPTEKRLLTIHKNSRKQNKREIFQHVPFLDNKENSATKQNGGK